MAILRSSGSIFASSSSSSFFRARASASALASCAALSSAALASSSRRARSSSFSLFSRSISSGSSRMPGFLSQLSSDWYPSSFVFPVFPSGAASPASFSSAKMGRGRSSVGFSSSVFFFFFPPLDFGGSDLTLGSTTSCFSVGISTGTFGSLTGNFPAVLAFFPWSPSSPAFPSSRPLLPPPCFSVAAASFELSSATPRNAAMLTSPTSLSSSSPARRAFICASNFPSLIMRRIRSSMSSV